MQSVFVGSCGVGVVCVGEMRCVVGSAQYGNTGLWIVSGGGDKWGWCGCCVVLLLLG